ncbi:MAG: hypothetical protein U0X58_06410 [Flavobacteriaceae bacterium]
MESTRVIYQKLEAFIRKYYLNELIKGAIFFVGLGLIYLLFTLFVEYFLWLKPLGRTLLFWTFVAVEVFLLLRYILFPIFKLLKFQKGIDYTQASSIIGNHFSEVSDKLTNFLQLASHQENSELLLASIDQKAQTLQPVPFSNAINIQANRKYLPLALIPVLLFVFFYLSGNSDVISQSFNRVVHFQKTYTPPAPFAFEILNPNLQTEQNKDFTLVLKTKGRVIPESVMIYLGEESYFMESLEPGKFQYKFSKPLADIDFHLQANAVISDEYKLRVVTVPSIANFEMQLQFPSYLRRKSETIKGSGNAIVPEGTRINWKISAVATNRVEWQDKNIQAFFSRTEQEFDFSKSIVEPTDYQILTSNEKVRHYEKLMYQISVVKDQFPSINVNQAPDSLKTEKKYLIGQVSDDYGLSRLQIVYYEIGKPQTARRGTIPVKNDLYDRFVFSFPSQLQVEEGVTYEYYFEIFDNDAVHHFKSSKSSVFSNRVATESEKQDQMLQQQNSNINGLEQSLKNQDKQLSELEKIQKSGKEKDNLEFKDQQKINDFINRQKQQDAMMKEFSEKMKENLDKFKSDKKDEFKEELQKRLEKNNQDIEKNKKLLDELKELTDKIKNEELMEKLDQFKQTSKNQTKNLEQLVELTKRYYVSKKAEQIADKLEELSKKQDKLAENEKENSFEKQNEINKEFDKIQEDLKDLQKENKELKSPMEIPSDAEKEKSIDEDLKKATEELQKDKKDKAKPKQKSAAQKMQQMSAKMQQSMQQDEMEQMDEDVKMLRQILDNLLAYSFSQEDIMKQFKGLKRGSPSFNKNLKIQQNLKQQFKHVDDSLFAMSLRNPKFSESITQEVGNVHYNIDKAIDDLVEAQVAKGTSHQQYAVTSANRLADFLSDLLNNMQMQMSGSGMGKPKPGQGQGMQLPDIIQKQEGLGEKMKKAMKKGNKPGEGEKPGESSSEGQGQGEKPGQSKSGKSGKDGKSGQSGSDKGSQSSPGKEGSQKGEDGEGNADAIMEIYKEQQQLRDALQKELEKQGFVGNGQNALNQMKELEKQLLNKGFNNETLQKVLNLKYELLKLQKAVQQQGEDKKRQSETNKKEFSNTTNALPSNLQQYLNSVEILNRQALPLRSNFNQKIQDYFKTND